MNKNNQILIKFSHLANNSDVVIKSKNILFWRIYYWFLNQDYLVIKQQERLLPGYSVHLEQYYDYKKQVIITMCNKVLSTKEFQDLFVLEVNKTCSECSKNKMLVESENLLEQLNLLTRREK